MAQRQSSTAAAGGQQSTLSETRSQTSQIGQHAAQAGGALKDRAIGQGKETVAETRRQARNLLSQASHQLSEQANAQQLRAALGLRNLGDQLRSMSSQSGQQGMAAELAQHASERAHQAAAWLEEREPGAVVAEVRDYARRHPGIFLAGRLTRNLTSGEERHPEQLPEFRPAPEDRPDGGSGR